MLDQHHQVAVSQPKEPHFFTHNWDKGLDWYKTVFPDSADYATLLDASTSYSMASLTYSRGDSRQRSKFENVPEKVSRTNPDARFIYLLRDPVERTYSGYWHSVRTGRESRGFREALRSNSLYLDVSDYHGQLSLWLDYFPLDSFLLLRFEDMKESPESAAMRCFEFLGRGEGIPTLQLDSAKNQTYENSQMGRRVNRLLIEYPSLSKHLLVLKTVFPKSVKDRVLRARRGSEPVPTMEKEERDFLIDYFLERNRSLELLTGVSVDGWQAERS